MIVCIKLFIRSFEEFPCAIDITVDTKTFDSIYGKEITYPEFSHTITYKIGEPRIEPFVYFIKE